MALRAIVNAETAKKAVQRSSASQLYRSMIKELPRVMALYDVDMPIKTARFAVAFHFRKHQNIKDQRVINILLAKGYMELEETLMQWKQKTHLLRLLEPPELDPEYQRTVEIYEKSTGLFD